MERTPRTKKSTRGNNSNSNSNSKSSNSKSTGKSAKTSKGKDNKTMLEEFFVEELKDIYWAEKFLVKSLPKMQKAATSEELANAIADHRAVTEEQVSRLEEVFEMMQETARAKKCEAMEGLIKEGEHVIEETEEGSATRDVALIMAAQKVEHYEIATYGGLVQLAKTIGREDVADILAQSLEEEKETDELLTTIAENNININASEEGEEGEEE
jgi:ferritin-like metal-binding protein YciE